MVIVIFWMKALTTMNMTTVFILIVHHIEVYHIVEHDVVYYYDCYYILSLSFDMIRCGIILLECTLRYVYI